MRLLMCLLTLYCGLIVVQRRLSIQERRKAWAEKEAEWSIWRDEQFRRRKKKRLLVRADRCADGSTYRSLTFVLRGAA